MGARVEPKPKERVFHGHEWHLPSDIDSHRLCEKRIPFHLRDLEKTEEQVQSGMFRVVTGPYFQISSPALRLIGHVSSSNLKFIQRIIRFQLTDLAAVKGFASL